MRIVSSQELGRRGILFRHDMSCIAVLVVVAVMCLQHFE